MRVYNTLTQEQGGVRPARARQGLDVRVRADRLQPHPHRQRAHLPVVRRDPPLPRVQGLRRHASSRTSPTSTTRSSTGPTKRAARPPRSPRSTPTRSSRRCTRSASRTRPFSPKATETIPEMIAHDRAAHRRRARVRVRRRRLLRGAQLPRRTASSPGRDIDEMELRRARRRSTSASATRSTSRCGSRPSPASRTGRARGARAGPAGTSSARRCRRWSSACRSTSTAAAAT